MRPGFLWLSLPLLGLVACATKSDIDRVSAEIAALHRQQDSLAASIGELRNTLATEMEEQRTVELNTSGEISRQLDDMERQLVQIQELLGQSQVVLQGLRVRAEGRDRFDERGPEGPVQSDTLAPAVGESERGTRAGEGEARDLYAAAMEQFRRGAYLTARTGFEEFLAAYPAHELAPESQFHVAETFRAEADNSRAIREYNRVVELYPNSEAAPRALYKAGLLQAEQGDKDLACQYFQRVLAGFPRSDEARLARDQAERLACR